MPGGIKFLLLVMPSGINSLADAWRHQIFYNFMCTVCKARVGPEYGAQENSIPGRL